MKKLLCKMICCLLVTISLVSVGCNILEKGESGALVVADKQIDVQGVTIYGENHFELPLVVTLEAVGCVVEWTDEENATVTWNGQKYTLNISEDRRCFSKVGDDTINYLLAAPGSTNYHFKPIENDVIIDNLTFRLILREMMGIPANLYADCESLTVYVEILHTAEEE
ncbi:MAG: hypothetical protein IJY39_09980 [Clostridia bacterium]|nr:hypothetical protein [Clostridia bacterium]